MGRTIVMWLLVCWIAFGVVMTIAVIGQERKPVSPFTAVSSLIISSAMVAGILYVGSGKW